jgi:streptogramin lyase
MEVRLGGKVNRCPCVFTLALGTLLFVPTARAGFIVAVSDLSNSSLDIYDGTSGTLLHQTTLPSVAGTPANPEGVAIGPNGQLFVADSANSVIDEFSATTGLFLGDFVTTGSGISALNTPSGITFGPDGNLYVDNWGSGGFGYINEYDGPNTGTPGAFVNQIVAPGSGPAGGLFDPQGLTFNGNNLYVADSSAGEISEFVGNSHTYNQFVPPGNPPSPLANPQSIVFDALGNLYVTDLTVGAVLEYNSSGTYLGAFVPGSSIPGNPIGMTFGPDGNLYLVDGSSVDVFNGTTGAFQKTLVAAGGSLVDGQFLAIETLAPEPSTWAFLVLGIVGLAWKRRRQ